MNKIPTAEKILDKQDYIDDTFESGLYSNTSIKKAMIEFAKIHVDAALEAAANSAILLMKKKSQYGKYRKWQNVKENEDVNIFNYQVMHSVDKQSILDSYPSTNIK